VFIERLVFDKTQLSNILSTLSQYRLYAMHTSFDKLEIDVWKSHQGKFEIESSIN